MNIVALGHVNQSNANAWLVETQFFPYCFIGEDAPGRNLQGSPLGEGPMTNPAQYRVWLWNEIKLRNQQILVSLRSVVICEAIVHDNTQEIALIVRSAAKWYKRELVAQEVACSRCLRDLTDYNRGERGMCHECAWDGNNKEQKIWYARDLKFFCDDCDGRISGRISKPSSRCQECRNRD